MKPIATDTDSFENLIRGDYVYVDKTRLLHRLASGKDGSQFFLSRPRRFGKSLLLSTLRCLFEGRKDLFRGLWIERRWAWNRRWNVLSLNMSDYDRMPGPGAFDQALKADLRERLQAEAIAFTADDATPVLLDRLIRGLAARDADGQVVVLIDEYDHPLGGLLDDRPSLLSMRKYLHGFYSTLKNNARSIRFLMMTGVTKFTKLSVFSGLNNLTDLSMDCPRYAGLLGYTTKELDRFFANHLVALARKRHETPLATKRALLGWYDSYRFCPDSSVRVTNPIAVGKALANGVIKEYWPRTGGAELIFERMAKANLLPDGLDGLTATEAELDVCALEKLPVKALLFQGGYLTIRRLVERNGSRVLELGIPNREVRTAIREGFLSEVMSLKADGLDALVDHAKRQLAKGELTSFLEESLYGLYAQLPPAWRIRNEAEAKRYFLLFMRMCGAKLRPEVPSLRGAADAVIETRKSIYVFEFKYGKSATAALRQIKTRGYAEPYRSDRRQIVLVGVNFNPKLRTIEAPACDEFEKLLTKGKTRT